MFRSDRQGLKRLAAERSLLPRRHRSDSRLQTARDCGGSPPPEQVRPTDSNVWGSVGANPSRPSVLLVPAVQDRLRKHVDDQCVGGTGARSFSMWASHSSE
jgi:hypothetical protein